MNKALFALQRKTEFGVDKKFENFEINFFVFATLFAPETREIVRIIRNVKATLIGHICELR